MDRFIPQGPPSWDRDNPQQPEHILAGTLHGAPPPMATLPPFIPVGTDSQGKYPSSTPTSSQNQNIGPASGPAPSDGMEWDSNLMTYTIDWQKDPGGGRPLSSWAEAHRWQILGREALAEKQRQRPRQQQKQTSTTVTSDERPKRQHLGTTMVRSLLPQQVSIPAPGLEYDFRMRVTLNSQSASIASGEGFKKWTTFIGGEWSGRFGRGVVISGGQDSQDLVHGRTLATQIEATHRLKTSDDIPAYIECKTRGFRTGPSEIMRAVQGEPDKTDAVDIRRLSHRTTISMRTTDERYAEVNFGLWIGSCLWTGSEVIYDAYKIT